MAQDGATPFADIEALVGREVLQRFADAERVESYGIRGWRVRRPRPVEWTHGTMDPNYLFIGLADRKQGTTLHIWNPLDWKGLVRHRAGLEAAGFKVMVGCLQYTRKRPYPVAAVAKVLDDARALMQSDQGEVPPYRTPRPKEGSAQAARAAVRPLASGPSKLAGNASRAAVAGAAGKAGRGSGRSGKATGKRTGTPPRRKGTDAAPVKSRAGRGKLKPRGRRGSASASVRRRTRPQR